MITSPYQLNIIKLLLLMQIKQSLYLFSYLNQCDSRQDQSNDNTETARQITARETALQIRETLWDDDFGNMTKEQTYNDTVLSATKDYVYNAGGELTRIAMPDNNSLEFQYDAGGQRTVKTFKHGGSVVSKMVYVNGFYTIRNNNVDKHISDGKYIIAIKVKNRDEKILYYSQNHIGSTAMLTDKNGDVFQRILYRPYGETWIAKGKGSNDIERYYSGQVYDKESGLYYMNARYYSPNIGMFISPDPANQNANHYAYASCNPLRFNDPTGMYSENGDGTVTVDSNDYQGMHSIAEGLGVSLGDFESANPQLQGRNSPNGNLSGYDYISPGDILNIPGAQENDGAADQQTNTNPEQNSGNNDDNSTSSNPDYGSNNKLDDKISNAFGYSADQLTNDLNTYGKVQLDYTTPLANWMVGPPILGMGTHFKIETLLEQEFGEGNTGINISKEGRKIFASQKIGILTATTTNDSIEFEFTFDNKDIRIGGSFNEGVLSRYAAVLFASDNGTFYGVVVSCNDNLNAEIVAAVIGLSLFNPQMMSYMSQAFARLEAYGY